MQWERLWPNLSAPQEGGKVLLRHSSLEAFKTSFFRWLLSISHPEFSRFLQILSCFGPPCQFRLERQNRTSKWESDWLKIMQWFFGPSGIWIKAWSSTLTHYSTWHVSKSAISKLETTMRQKNTPSLSWPALTIPMRYYLVLPNWAPGNSEQSQILLNVPAGFVAGCQNREHPFATQIEWRVKCQYSRTVSATQGRFSTDTKSSLQEVVWWELI